MNKPSARHNLLGLSLFALLAAPAFAAGCGDGMETAGPQGGGGVAGSGGSGASGGTTTSTGDSGGMAGTGGTTTSTTGTGGGGGTGNNGMPSDKYPAPHPAPPKVVTYGGPILQSPRFYPVFFANDDPAFTAKAIDFTNKVGGTAYWTAIAAEWGVGAATGQPPIQSPEKLTGTIDDAAIQTWLAGKLNADDPLFPLPDENTLFVLYYPPKLNITIDGGGQLLHSCQDFGGYHSNTTLDAAHGKRNVAYAVIPRCVGFAGMNELDAVTATASHEMVEAASDPYPQSDPAYAQVDNSHIYWLFALGGGENADLCAQSDSSFVKFPELDYVVQRSWSNKSVAAGHDPCVPTLPGEVYFNSAPVLPDTISLNVGQIIKVKGVQIPVGESRTIEVDLFSDAKTSGPWQVEAFDIATFQGGSPSLSFSFDKKSGVNGEKLNLTIEVLKASQFKSEIFMLSSKLGAQQTFWVGIVGN